MMKMRHICSFLVFLCAVAAPAGVRADTITYSFTAGTTLNGTITSASFSYTGTALLVTPSTTVLASADCTSTAFTRTTTCDGARLSSRGTTGGVLMTRLSLFASDTSEPNTQLPESFFESFGVHADANGNTLTITDTPAISATPEPSSFVLLGTGIVGMFGFAKRRLMA